MAVSEDDIDASRAPLIEHLIELRQRLMRAMAFLAVAFVVCYYFSEDIYGFLAQPLANAYGGEQARMIITAPQEAFFTYLKLSLFGGFCLAFPMIANQIWAFVAPGLYSHEKRAFLPFILATPVLFLVGASLVYFLIMPLALEFFLSFQTTGQDTPLPIQLETRVSEYLSLVMTLILAFGISFQLPILLILMARVGLTSADGLKRGRKYAIVGIFGAAAILTPPDPISQIGLALPIILLYEFSVWAVSRTERKQAAARAAEEAED